MDKRDINKGDPIPGAVAAQMARGIPQHKAMASVGLDTKAPAPVIVAGVKR